MYIGHFAPALAAAAASPRAPRLGTLFVAAQLVDLAFFAFVLSGIERMRVVPGITAMNPMDLHHMPYTHSLAGTAVWAAGFGLAVGFALRSRMAGGIAAVVVLSHWFVDLLVHRPDLTLAGAPPKLGLGLWDQPMVAIPLELALTALAFWFFLRRTRGPIVPALVLVAALLTFQAINWFGPQPRAYSPALPLSALLSYLILFALAAWVGRSRRHRRGAGLAGARRAR
ncbi:hypothetical protein [Qipengyuania sediminis]|uniref:hypothetical protein n=1 Tax=Qipengyuania sediminis TaxID=1532023 RepID=UPI0010593F56|nr:hypothetical protein [Qipengyuania sediminis]